MSNMVNVNSTVIYGETLDEIAQQDIQAEVMLFRATATFAAAHGGMATQSFLAALPEEWKAHPDMRIDSRLHMLMPGFYPCIPGWHHDDIPRSRPDGQPNYISPEYKSRHCMALFNGHIAPTLFATGNVLLPDGEPGEITYGKWHPLIDQAIEIGQLDVEHAPSERLIYFDWQSLHRGTAAVERGWRFFIRASIGNPSPPANKIRNQVQVYLSEPTKGW